VKLPHDGSVVMFMIVRRPDGRPTGYPMTGRFRDGELYVSTYRKAAKARYLLADDRVCCVVPDPESPAGGVALYGRAHEAPPDAFLARVPTRERKHADMVVPSSVTATVRDRLDSQKRMVFRISVERQRTIGGAP
jgi:Pyridoxamine 5'-phosphate oxidase